MIEYNVGQYITGYLVIAIYKTLANKEDLTSENIKLANVVEWCNEALAGFVFMVDDLTDGSSIRRGKLPWYKQNDVGLQAINHALMLENSVHLVLLKYFRERNICSSLIEVFYNTILSFFARQTLESTFVKDGKPQLILYTLENFLEYSTINTGYMAVSNQFILASYLAGKYSKEFEGHAHFFG